MFGYQCEIDGYRVVTDLCSDVLVNNFVVQGTSSPKIIRQLCFTCRCILCTIDYLSRFSNVQTDCSQVRMSEMKTLL